MLNMEEDPSTPPMTPQGSPQRTSPMAPKKRNLAQLRRAIVNLSGWLEDNYSEQIMEMNEANPKNELYAKLMINEGSISMDPVFVEDLILQSANVLKYAFKNSNKYGMTVGNAKVIYDRLFNQFKKLVKGIITAELQDDLKHIDYTFLDKDEEFNDQVVDNIVRLVYYIYTLPPPKEQPNNGNEEMQMQARVLEWYYN